MDQIIIYGAGARGKLYYDFFKSLHMEKIIYAYCDENYKQIQSIGEIPVLSYHDLKNRRIPFIISVAELEGICEKLQSDGNLYYVNIESWILSYNETESDRVRMLVMYRATEDYYKKRKDKNNLSKKLNNLDKKLNDTISDLCLDNVVKIYGGICSCCCKKTVFVAFDYQLRGNYKCIFCGSVPRQRAIMKVLQNEVPEWRNMIIHESSPSGVTFRILKEQCAGYTYSYWHELKPLGIELQFGGVNQNLENLTFEDEKFDVFITQDVLEHVNRPEKVFAEIARTLKKGGLHIFTTPLTPFRKTKARIKMRGDKRELILPPIYHGNPICKEGSLVTYEWGGYDFLEIIDKAAGTESKIVEFPNNKENFENGLEGDFLHVIISKKV